MPEAFVLMTAMPPTTGHLQLIQFAEILSKGITTVILNTQPHEPFPKERADAVRWACRQFDAVMFKHYDKAIEQDPSAPGFWGMWSDIMEDNGFRPGDYIVTSEPYGKKLAEVCGGIFMPYDIDRTINPAKATPVREDPIGKFAQILPEFQHNLLTTVTIFGAESTGKTTLSRQLHAFLDSYLLFEYARPYLENTTNEITVRSMNEIWLGQWALQLQGQSNLKNRPFIIQDTDLFSTVGYWDFPHWKSIGDCPEGLRNDAIDLKSDLYIVTKSNIPFEQDPLRYGGDEREGSDEYWIDVCEKYELPYVVLQSDTPWGRVVEATPKIREVAAKKAQLLQYDRGGL